MEEQKAKVKFRVPEEARHWLFSLSNDFEAQVDLEEIEIELTIRVEPEKAIYEISWALTDTSYNTSAFYPAYQGCGTKDNE